MRRTWAVWWMTLALLLYPGAVLAQRATVPATFALAAEAVRPAVINIVVPRGGSAPDLFWGEPIEEDLSGGPWSSIGAGVIVETSGVAITSARVVQGTPGIEAVTADGRTHGVTIVGVDERSDLAVLRLSGPAPFPFAKLGDSARMDVGDWVIAIGSPYGLRATVTAGVLSAKARHVRASGVDELFQTDAAINLGGTGGPLVNMAGEVIGINTTVVEGGCGIAFAVPSNLARRIAAELLERGRVSRGWLGVSGQPLTGELARALGVGPMTGLLVADVVRSGPGAKAGLRPGDVLLELDGQALTGPDDLRSALAGSAPGRVVALKAWRDGREQLVRATLGEDPDAREETYPAGLAKTILGFEVRPITPEQGVVVTRVRRLGPAGLAGLRRGDVLREINRRPIRAIEDFESVAEHVKEGDQVAMLVQRGDVALYVAFVATAERRSGRMADE